MQTMVLQGFPFCTPGFHFGIILITLSASLSRLFSKGFTIFKSVMVPSAATINCTITFP